MEEPGVSRGLDTDGNLDLLGLYEASDGEDFPWFITSNDKMGLFAGNIDRDTAAHENLQQLSTVARVYEAATNSSSMAGLLDACSPEPLAALPSGLAPSLAPSLPATPPFAAGATTMPHATTAQPCAHTLNHIHTQPCGSHSAAQAPTHPGATPGPPAPRHVQPRQVKAPSVVTTAFNTAAAAAAAASNVNLVASTQQDAPLPPYLHTTTPSDEPMATHPSWSGFMYGSPSPYDSPAKAAPHPVGLTSQPQCQPLRDPSPFPTPPPPTPYTRPITSPAGHPATPCPLYPTPHPHRHPYPYPYPYRYPPGPPSAYPHPFPYPYPYSYPPPPHPYPHTPYPYPYYLPPHHGSRRLPSWRSLGHLPRPQQTAWGPHMQPRTHLQAPLQPPPPPPAEQQQQSPHFTSRDHGHDNGPLPSSDALASCCAGPATTLARVPSPGGGLLAAATAATAGQQQMALSCGAATPPLAPGNGCSTHGVQQQQQQQEQWQEVASKCCADVSNTAASPALPAPSDVVEAAAATTLNAAATAAAAAAAATPVPAPAPAPARVATQPLPEPVQVTVSSPSGALMSHRVMGTFFPQPYLDGKDCILVLRAPAEGGQGQGNKQGQGQQQQGEGQEHGTGGAAAAAGAAVGSGAASPTKGGGGGGSSKKGGAAPVGGVGDMVSRSGFERLSGSMMAKWHRSIRVSAGGGRGRGEAWVERGRRLAGDGELGAPGSRGRGHEGQTV